MADLTPASSIDTIVAQATPAGRGGVSIVRISGPDAALSMRRFVGSELEPRQAKYTRFLNRDGASLDQGIALFFPGPDSFTGEDVLELHCHGGPVIVDLLIKEATHYGCRLARPGEFSERAFLNDKIDLVQAEAIADLIDSSSQEAARGALESLQGAFSARVQDLLESLIQLRIHVESAIDFPEEEIDFLADTQIGSKLTAIIQQITELFNQASEGSKLREGIKVVIIGKPNAGKSSLLNALAQRESAIVTDIPGTTRDLLRESIMIDGIPLHIIDTAGLRESPDKIEQEGIRRAVGELERADHILLLSEDTQSGEKLALDTSALNHPEISNTIAQRTPVTLIQNKIDLSNKTPAVLAAGHFTDTPYPVIKLSAKTGAGLDLLRAHLKQVAGIQTSTEGTFTARRRHLTALENTLQSLRDGQQQLTQNRAGELLAEDLREAQQLLSEITGEFSSDDLLGRIFSDFCIGK